jgi:hypothetical protein
MRRQRVKLIRTIPQLFASEVNGAGRVPPWHSLWRYTSRVRHFCRLSLAIGASVALSSCVEAGRDLGAQVTRDAVRAVRLGMTQAEVEGILGAPFSEEQDEPGHVVLTYARRPFGVRFYPMLWVHLRDDRVGGVYAKRYGISIIDDDIGIYSLSRSRDGVFERFKFGQLIPD